MDNSTQQHHRSVTDENNNNNNTRPSQDYIPERPGSAPPTFTLNSTNLFAFGASSSSDFFSGMRQQTPPSTDETPTRYDNMAETKQQEVAPKHGRVGSMAIRSDKVPLHSRSMYAMPQAYASSTVPVSAIPSRRKNSIEMFLSQSPSQALGGEFMKMNFASREEPSSISDGFLQQDSEFSGYYNPLPKSSPPASPAPPQWPSVYEQQQQPTPQSNPVYSPAPSTPNNYAERERRSSSSASTPKLCKFFAQGHCRMDSKCKFSHSENANKSSKAMYSEMAMRGPSERSGRRNNGGTSQGGSNSPPPDSNQSSEDDPFPSGGKLGLEDIRRRVFSMSKDQNGCRLLQEQLCLDQSDMRDLIFEESLNHLPEMMVDPFGNYLFQKLLERVTETQRTSIVRRVSSNLVPAALNLHGTRSVQKVVEVCGSREQLEVIVNALRDDAVRLCIDSNGNHVIQRALQHMRPVDNQFVFDAVAKECTTVGTHRHGCCVLQRCLDAANKEQKMAVIQQVENHAMKLMQDPYGNYVVQYVLDSCSPLEAAGVIQQPLGHVFELSIQKFSSNVIEKCLEKASIKVREFYLMEIMSCPKIDQMLQDQFANYVVQRALSVCSNEHGLMLVNAIRPHLPGMKNTSGGRRITARILKRFPTINLDLPDDEVLPLHARDMNVKTSSRTGVSCGMVADTYPRLRETPKREGKVLPREGINYHQA